MRYSLLCCFSAVPIGPGAWQGFTPVPASSDSFGYISSCGDRLDRLGGHVGDLQADLEWRLTIVIASERARSHDVPRRAVDGGLQVNGERVAAASTEGVHP